MLSLQGQGRAAEAAACFLPPCWLCGAFQNKAPQKGGRVGLRGRGQGPGCAEAGLALADGPPHSTPALGPAPRAQAPALGLPRLVFDAFKLFSLFRQKRRTLEK